MTGHSLSHISYNSSTAADPNKFAFSRSVVLYPTKPKSHTHDPKLEMDIHGYVNQHHVADKASGVSHRL